MAILYIDANQTEDRVFVAGDIDLDRFSENEVVHIFIEKFYPCVYEIIHYVIGCFCQKTCAGENNNELCEALKTAAVFNQLKQKSEKKYLLNEAYEKPLCGLHKNI
jgi:hypothetical protein